jgi:ABC-type bacteriocin/lantibiotic exporter with double-glycine peptidase domain
MKPAFSHVYSGFSSFRFGKATLDDVLKQLNDCKEVPIISGIKKDKMILKSKISFSDVSFSYPNSDTHSIDSVSLEIPIGTSFGIVGSTGAGKTTFVDIFLGLLDPTSGTIKIGDHQLTIDNKSNWQNCLGYVPQEIFLSDNSLAENIAFGVDKSEIEMDKVEKCSRLAQIHDFVCNELPDRYDSMVGERGIRLSGGQRQRIGIARALYNDPDILVFDEATSALDSLTEKEVMHSIESLSEIKTVIIIAHRLTTVKNCNKIVILEKGRIKALGKYDDLIMSDKYFQKLAGA